MPFFIARLCAYFSGRSSLPHWGLQGRSRNPLARDGSTRHGYVARMDANTSAVPKHVTPLSAAAGSIGAPLTCGEGKLLAREPERRHRLCRTFAVQHAL